MNYKRHDRSEIGKGGNHKEADEPLMASAH